MTSSLPVLAALAVTLALGMAGLGFYVGSASSSNTADASPLPPVSLQSTAARPAAARTEPTTAREPASAPETISAPFAQMKPQHSEGSATQALADQPFSSIARATTQRPRPVLPVQQPRMPLIMLDMDLNALGLSASQQSMVLNLQKQFLNQIGGTTQNPTDPAYLKRWLTAAPAADEILRAQIGWTAYNAYGIASARAKLAGQ